MADVTISQLNNVVTLGSNDVLPISQNNTTFKTTVSQLTGAVQVSFPYNNVGVAVAGYGDSAQGLNSSYTGLGPYGKQETYGHNMVISKDRKSLWVAGASRAFGTTTNGNWPYIGWTKFQASGDVYSLRSFVYDYFMNGYEYFAVMTNEKRIFIAGYWDQGNGRGGAGGYLRFDTSNSFTSNDLVTLAGAPAGTTIRSFDILASHAGNYAGLYIIGSNNNLYGFGRSAEGQMGQLTNRLTLGYTGISNVNKIVTAGYQCLCALLNDGTLRTLGRSYYGQAGNGVTTTTSYSTPQTVLRAAGTPLTNVVEVYSGNDNTNWENFYAKDNNNVLWGWGYSGYGSLGVINNNNPYAIQVATNVGDVYGGGQGRDRVMYTDSTRRYLYGLGDNNYGQLATSSTTAYYSTPRLIIDANNYGSTIKKVLNIGGAGGSGSPTYGSTVVLLNNGRMFVVGYVQLGQASPSDSPLGENNVIAEVSPPVDYSSDTIIDINMVGTQTNEISVQAITSNGDMYAYGYNRNGKLGGITMQGVNNWLMQWALMI